MTSSPNLRVRRRLAFAPIAVVLFVVVAAGCGSGSVGYSEGNGDRGNGKALFVKSCGSCHTLADAGTSGKIGPNLDYAFLQSRRDGLGESTFVQVVRGQIAYPVVKPSTGAPGMPANILEGQDADDVASYVGSVAGREDLMAAAAAAKPATTPATTTPAGGGGGGAGNAAAGKSVFESVGCGSCHTLADAGTTGAVGPNLDDAKPDAALVKERVTNGKAPMPSFKGQLSAAQIADVAAYVSSVAGK
jgi:mono/diheme cytochrome c family protein